MFTCLLALYTLINYDSPMHVLIGTRNLFFSANGRGRRGAEGPHGAGIQAATDTQRRHAETAAQKEKHQNILQVRQS